MIATVLAAEQTIREIEWGLPESGLGWLAMVLVCGITQAGRLPNTLCRPPAMGSSLLAQQPRSTSSRGVCPGSWWARCTKNPPLR